MSNYIKSNFVKCRRKFKSAKRSRFKKVIVIDHGINSNKQIYLRSNTKELELLFTEIYRVLLDIFTGFDTQIMESLIAEYLGITLINH